ncbi:MAG: asparagine synthase-related protein, partial [Candidatus Heimdallarchaeota archaeon]
YSYNEVEYNIKNSYKMLYDATKNMLIDFKDKKIGFPLSGGIDSTTILYIANEINQKENLNLKITAYNQIFDFRDESEFAQKIADKTGIELKIINQTTEMNLKEIDEMLKIFPDPLMANAHIFSLSKLMKKEGNVASISALGGDECWGGYPSHRIFHNNMFSKDIYTAQHLRTKLLRLGLTPISKQALWMRYNSRFPATIPFLNPKKYRKATKIIGKNITSYLKNTQYLWHYYDYLDSNSNLVNKGRLSLWEANEYLTFEKCCKLYKYQINSLGTLAGLDVLFPFLEPKYVKYALSIDKSEKIKNGISKWGMREMMKDKLPKENLMRGAYGDKFGWGETYLTLWEKGYKDFVEEKLTKQNVTDFGVLNWNWITKTLGKLAKRHRGAEARVLISMAFFQRILELHK